MSDAIERLRNRNRPTVPSRDASLLKPRHDEKAEFSHLVETKSSHDDSEEIDQNSDLDELAKTKQGKDEKTEFSHSDKTKSLYDDLVITDRNLDSGNLDSGELSNVSVEKDKKTKFSHSGKMRSSKQEIASTSQLPTPDADNEIEVVRRTVRLDSSVDMDLERLCRQERITREVFLEAAYLVGMQEQSFMQEILKVAKSRYRKRKEVGEQRKFRTLEQRYR